MNKYQKLIQEFKVLLGVEVALATALLEDGVTKVEFEALEVGKEINCVSESGEKSKCPEGTHTTEDGTKVTVDAEGKISAVVLPEPKEEVEVEAAAEKKSAKLEEEVEVEVEDEKPSMDEVMELMRECLTAVSGLVKDVSMMKEEMASYKSKMESLSKTPAAEKIKTFNAEVEKPTSAFESRLEALKILKDEHNKTKKFK
jgi:hypothetical protein